MRRVRRAVVLVALGLGMWAMAANPAAAQDERAGRVLQTTVDSAITPVIANHLSDGLDHAVERGYDAFLVRLDTPGGLDTSMRAIVQDILASPIPVIVHIAPAGARGASAGAIITFSAHVAAMSPGTAIGAATPVSGESGEDLEAKIINDATAYADSLAELRDRDRTFITETVTEGRSASATEALELGVIDVIADGTNELLVAIDGMTVTVDRGGTAAQVTLHTAGAAVDTYEMGFFRSIQNTLADPNIAFLLMSIGTLALVYELASGVGIGIVFGLTFIVLGLFGLSVLSVNIVGIVFLLLAGALFVAELFAPGLGVAAAAGTFALVLSAVFLFDDTPGLQVSFGVIVPIAVVVGGFVVIAGRFAARAARDPSTMTGLEAMIGKTAAVDTTYGAPRIFVDGAWWSVAPASGHPLDTADGRRVRVTKADGLVLVVELVPRALPPTDDSGGPGPGTETPT